MNLDDIRQILDMMREHDLAEFELERDGLKVRVRKSAAVQVRQRRTRHGPRPAPWRRCLRRPARRCGRRPGRRRQTSGASISRWSSRRSSARSIASPEPGAPPFVEVGDMVKKGPGALHHRGDEADERDRKPSRDGEIVDVYVENGQPVQYGERLFAMKVCR